MNDHKKCFIENDCEIDEDTLYYMVESIVEVTDNVTLNFDRLFDIVIVEAASKRVEVWQAIKQCKYIFISTAFIGESGQLLEDMCEMALAKRVSNKVIVNFRNSDSYISGTKRGLRMLKILMDRYNVEYVNTDTDRFVEICKELFA